MPHCYLPWTHIDISSMGEMTPCCKFKSSKYPHKIYNINNSSIDDYVNSPTLTEVKNDFLNNKWPKGCERCRIEEENGIESKRIQDAKLWKDHLKEDYQTKGFVTASIAFGNTCNLKCITCSPYASSKWQQEWKSITGLDIKSNHFYKKDFVESFSQVSKNLIHLDIPGGEPFLSGVEQQKQLLEIFIKEDRAQDISLHYTTNCTVFPDESWIKLWENFKSVEIQLSIDGVESRFEYIRFPASWKQVDENVEKYKNLSKEKSNLKIAVATTVSAYNIAYLDELLIYLEGKNLGVPYLGRVHNPIYIRPTVWKTNAKDFIIERIENSKFNLSNFTSLIKNEDVSEHFDLFRNRLLRHDAYRKLSFKETFPEMFPFLKD